ncbi:MAG: STAS/SEC14 domain-containing protein [Pedobacter sp.]|nr:MAG: STAS/SEC14 domain-containing protein [Pedobacter sp.]
MVSLITNLPPHVLGLRATSEVTEDDLKSVLLPGLERLNVQFGEIHYILILETGVENFTAGAWLQDMIAGLKHFTKWKKMAIVTDQKMVANFTDFFSYLVPGVARGFELSQVKDAQQWVCQKED